MAAIQLDDLKEFDKNHYLAKLVFDSEQARVALFCLEPGQELPVHVSTSEVLFQVIEGTGKLVVGEEKISAKAGTFAVCGPEVPHGLEAEGRFVVLAVIAPRPS